MNEQEIRKNDAIFERAERKISAKATIVIQLHEETLDKLKRTAKFWCMSIDELTNAILLDAMSNKLDNRGDID